MCGISGFVGFKDDSLLERMAAAIYHRGPDESGYHKSDDISVGFRRLSIIDLTTGSQPLYNEDGSIFVVCNGEIYNFADIREDLIAKGHHFKSRSDTEVIVHAYEEYGIDCVKKFNGMFAIVIWDGKAKTLFLVRDRLGKKPIYYMQSGEKFLFASEIKSLLLLKGYTPQVNYQSIDDFLTLRYVPGTEIMFKDIYIIPPAHILKYRNGKFSLHEYWKVAMQEGIPGYSEKDYEEHFADLLSNAVKKRMISDVPIGVYLSGGVDSSVVAAYMQMNSNNQIKTFSHGFDQQTDELKYARMVAKYLNTEHHEVFIKNDDLTLLPKIIYHMEMPIGNSDIVGFYLLAQMAREYVKVILAGEGSDELFGSYVHQKILYIGSQAKKYIPYFLLRSISKTIKFIPLSLLNRFFPYQGYSLDNVSRNKLADYFSARGLSQEYFSLNSLFNERQKEGLYTKEFYNLISNTLPQRKTIEGILSEGEPENILNKLILMKYKYWLPTYHLLKEDKISMAHSIEQRFPFLDYELVEFMAKVPVNMKMRGSVTKYILRKTSKRLLPEEIVNRPKGPILVPINKCFDNRFNELIMDMLSESRIKKRGLFNYSYISMLIRMRKENPFLYDRQLFALLVLEIWMQTFIDKNIMYPEAFAVVR